MIIIIGSLVFLVVACIIGVPLMLRESKNSPKSDDYYSLIGGRDNNN